MKPIHIPQELAEILRSANHIVVLTGAGISAESGIPTFREAQTGLWAKYDPQELATSQAFSANPDLVWSWYKWRQEIVAQAIPNPGHYALAQIESLITEHGHLHCVPAQVSRFTLITQNVDGLHQRAGSQNIIELHGNIHQSKCFDCNTMAEDEYFTSDEHPRCIHCGGLLRPDVVWFGENLPPSALQAAWDVAQNCDVFFSIGTSALVQPAASLPVVALRTIPSSLRENGACLVEVNPNDTPITILAAYSLQGPSGEVLPELVKSVWPING